MRYLSYFFTLIALMLPVLGYLEYIYLLGFPDGFITEYGHTGRIFYFIFVWPILALGFYFIYLGWTSTKQKTHKKLAISIFIFILYIAIIAVIDHYLYTHLNHGQGV